VVAVERESRKALVGLRSLGLRETERKSEDDTLQSIAIFEI